MADFYSKCVKRPGWVHVLNPQPCDQASLRLVRMLKMQQQMTPVERRMAQIDQFVKQNQ